MATLTFAWRALRRAPAFAIAAALTLAIGIGSTTAVFTVLETVLLKPLPYREPERLAGVWFTFPGMGVPLGPQSASSYLTFRRFSRSIEGMAIIGRGSVNLAADVGDAAPERVAATYASASLFPLLGVPLERGRAFTPQEDSPRGDPVVVISDGLWQRQFGGDAAAVGKHLKIDGVERTVIGIASPDFRFPDARTQLWLPIGVDSTTVYGGAFGNQGFVRLKPGVTIDALQRELNSLLPRIAERYPEVAPGFPTAAFLASSHARVVIHPMRNDIVGGFASIVWIAGAAGMLLLLISFANVASLLLTRAEGRQRELAVRVALGAGPSHVVTQFLSESLVLAAIGGVFGLFLAWVGVRAFVRAGPAGIPRLSEMGLDGTVLAFAAVVTLLMALLCSLVPALRYDTRRLAARLRDGTRGGTTGRDRQRARRTLVVSQVAFATMLVSGAGMLFSSFARLRAIQPGFDAEHTLVLWLSLPTAAYKTDADVVRFSTELLQHVSAVPGVRAAGISSKVPLNNIGINFTPVFTDADRDATNKLPPSATAVTASSGYFDAMGIPLIAGRTFDREDRQAANEVIIDRRTAMDHWKDSTGTASVGRRLRFTQNDWLTVIGVVGAVHDTSLASPPGAIVYMPNVAVADTNQSQVARTMAVVVRAAGDPRALIKPVERAIADVDRGLPPFGVTPMSDTVEQSVARLTFVMTIVGVTACVALLLAAIGLYGVLAYMVSLRSREISVRMAMGALPSSVARLVTGQGATLAGVGIVVGIAIFFMTSRFLRAVINGVQQPDALVVGAVALLLMVIALAASWIPARRAARVDPARALSGE
ncbi:MAG TPA: ABC transporter permease [Gemmatimonadaceae bacterium]|jgi:predicted permease